MTGPFPPTSATAASTAAPSFDALFRREYPGIIRDIDFVVGDTELAKERAQEAFVRLCVSWNNASLYDYPKSWVSKVGVRLGFRARARRNKLDDRTALNPGEASAANPAALC